ncbi:hypothetical protein ACFQL4_19980 [Halosimplex aquaticum]
MTPGEVVEVTVTVENTGGSFVPDLRLVDRVPGNMRVVSGTPRLATALGSGDTATFTYQVVAERGTHEWPLLAIGRDFSGALEREAIVDVEGRSSASPRCGRPRRCPSASRPRCTPARRTPPRAAPVWSSSRSASTARATR